MTHVHPLTAWGKRTLDLVSAVVFLVATMPLFPLLALAIRLDSKGPVLFRQMRIGRSLHDRTELFEMVKFRSMYVDAEARTGAVWAGRDDPRITRVGRFLRKTRLDELPQLWNVLRGEMSLIGPRPERPGIFGRLDQAIPFYAERTWGVAPGITGLAQVHQGYDETLEDVRRKLLFDHAYAAALTSPLAWLRMELLVMFKTVTVMAGGRGQ
jgi:lipopolysaccharide/colanic/teichoic acid biosynthesis glycosyltransferase